MTALLSLERVSKRFRGLLAVDGVSFDVSAGDLFAIIGPNGAGKTTLFNMIAGAIVPDQGSINFAGEPIGGLPADAVCRLGIARTFQIVRPFPALTVEDNVVIGALLHIRDVGKARMRAGDILRRLDLFEQRNRIAATLTLPDRKRLEVARALATEPRLLLLDEVMAGLRPTESDRMVAILRSLNRDSGLTIGSDRTRHARRHGARLQCSGARSRHRHRARQARGDRARSRRRAVLSRCGAGVMLRVEQLDVFLWRCAGARWRIARNRGGRHSRDCRRQRRRQNDADPRARRYEPLGNRPGRV